MYVVFVRQKKCQKILQKIKRYLQNIMFNFVSKMNEV